MKLSIISLIISLLSFVNSQTITKVSSPIYGVSSIITIDGTSFGSSPSIKINTNTVCTVKQSTATQITCGPFAAQYTPVSNTFQVQVTFSGGGSASSTLKYASPTIGYYDIDYDNRYFFFQGYNLISPISNYKLTVLDTQTSTLKLSPSADSSSQINFQLPITLTGGLCTFTVSDTVGFTYPDPLDSIIVAPVIKQITPSSWSPSVSKSITMSGIFFGKTIQLLVGGNTISDVSVGDDGTAVFNSPIGFVSSKDIIITTTKDYSLNAKNMFTYDAPMISNINQVNDTLNIEASNIGIDKSFITVSINNVSVDYTLENGIISVVLSSIINVGETKVSIKADVQNVDNLILIKPVITKVSNIPSNGGKVTIEGAFLNDCFFKLYDNTSTLIKDMIDSSGNNLCTLSSTGKVATCITPAMTADSKFTIMAIRYTDNSDKTSVSESNSMNGTVYYVEPVTETPTVTETQTQTPTITETETVTQTPTPNPSNSTELSEDTPSTSSQIVLSNLFIILSALVYIFI